MTGLLEIDYVFMFVAIALTIAILVADALKSRRMKDTMNKVRRVFEEDEERLLSMQDDLCMLARRLQVLSKKIGETNDGANRDQHTAQSADAEAWTYVPELYANLNGLYLKSWDSKRDMILDKSILNLIKERGVKIIALSEMHQEVYRESYTININHVAGSLSWRSQGKSYNTMHNSVIRTDRSSLIAYDVGGSRPIHSVSELSESISFDEF